MPVTTVNANATSTPSHEQDGEVVATEAPAAASFLVVLPLDLMKSIGDFLWLVDFRQLCGVSIEWNQIATGKPRRTRQFDMTPEQFGILCKSGAAKSPLTNHVSDLLVKHLVREEKKGEKKLDLNDMEQSTKTLRVMTEAENIQHERDSVLNKVNNKKKQSEDDESEDEMEVEREKEKIQLYYPPLVTSQITQLAIFVPHIDALNCSLDPFTLEPYAPDAVMSWNSAKTYDREAMEKQPSLTFPPLLTNLTIVFDNEFSDNPEALHSGILRCITAISELKHVSYLQLDCTQFSHYDGSYFMPLATLAPTLQTFILSDVFNSAEEDNIRWTQDQIALFRKFTNMQFLDVAEWWSLEQLELLLAEPIPFPELEYIGSRNISMTDEMIPLIIRLTKLKFWCLTVILTRDVSWLAQMKHLDTVQISIEKIEEDDVEVDMEIFMATIVQCQSFTDLTLLHRTLGDAEMKTICSALSLKYLELMHMDGLTSLECLTVNDRILQHMCELKITNCESLPWSEILRIASLRATSAENPFVFLLHGALSDRTAAELNLMQKDENWPKCLVHEAYWDEDEDEEEGEEEAGEENEGEGEAKDEDEDKQENEVEREVK